MDYIERMGQYLKKCRKFLGMTRKDMALELGCSESTIYGIETGRRLYDSEWMYIYKRFVSYKIPASVAINLM